MLSFLSSISWAYYLIIALVLALLASGYVLSNKIEEVGSLQSQNTALTQQLTEAEADKDRLNATLQLSSQKSLEDSTERDKLRSDVAVLNKKITSLTRLTKSTPSDVKFNNQSSDDLYLSSELTSLLNAAYCNSKVSLCANTKQSSK